MKKIMDLNLDEFRDQLIDFFEFTRDLSEDFYKKNNLVFEDYFDFRKKHKIDDKYLFLNSFHNNTGIAYFFYDKYKDFTDDIDEIFTINYFDNKKRLKLEMTNFFSLLDKSEEKLEKLNEDYGIQINLKDLKTYLIYSYYNGDVNDNYFFGSALYLYLKKTNKLHKYLNYFKRDDITIFKIHSNINILPYLFDIENYYNLILTSNPFFSETISFIKKVKFYELKFLKYQINFKMSFILFDYEIYHILNHKKTYFLNLNSYIRKRFEDIEIIKFYKENRFNQGLNLFTFDKLKKITEECYKNLYFLNRDQILYFF